MTTTTTNAYEAETDERIAVTHERFFSAYMTRRNAEATASRLNASATSHWAQEVEAAKVAEAAARDAYREADRQYAGWSRFYLVRNSNGHIHSSLDCSTCTPTTDFGWLTSASGLTEGDAVAQHGERLCTVCFPTAPSAWVTGYYERANAEAKAAKAAAKADRDAAKAAKVAARSLTHHYGLRLTRANDGTVIDHTTDRWFTATTLKAATREAKDYAGAEWIAKVEVVDTDTRETVWQG